MSVKNTKALGDIGEQKAARFLVTKNYEILDRNYRWARGEIDIVAKKDGRLIFVEVKTARGEAFGTPESWVDERKQRQLGQVAQRYLQENNIEDMDCQFDVVAVSVVGPRWKINHIENAFWL